jgi:hypothetical protein
MLLDGMAVLPVVMVGHAYVVLAPWEWRVTFPYPIVHGKIVH